MDAVLGFVLVTALVGAPPLVLFRSWSRFLRGTEPAPSSAWGRIQRGLLRSGLIAVTLNFLLLYGVLLFDSSGKSQALVWVRFIAMLVLCLPAMALALIAKGSPRFAVASLAFVGLGFWLFTALAQGL